MNKLFAIGVTFIILLPSCQENLKENQPEHSAKIIFHPFTVTEGQTADTKFKDYDVDYQDTLGIGYVQVFENKVGITLNLNCDKPSSSSSLHIHEGTMDRPLMHWNQKDTLLFCSYNNLGTTWDKKYAGDLGNIHFDENGDGTFYIESDLWTLGTDQNDDILDKVIVIHYFYEDFALACRKNTHNNNHVHHNPKIGAGVIQKIN